MKHSFYNHITRRGFTVLLAGLLTAFALAGFRASAGSPASPPAPLPGIYYTVTSNADNTDVVIHGGTGTAADPFQMSSLRGAVLNANTQITSVVGPITINVPAANGTYSLSVANPETPAITGTTAFNDLEVGSGFNHETTIVGVGGTPRIEQTVGGNDVITTGFADASYTPQAVTLTLQNLEITGGSFSGIFTGVDNSTGVSSTTIVSCNIHDNSNPFGSGGGIFNQTGNLSVQTSTFSNNSSSSQGGGIFYDLPNAAGPGSSGTLSVTGSKFNGNQASASGGFPAGGGIFIDAAGTGNSLSITNSSFESNAATGGGSGGAVAFVSNNPVSVTLSRFFGNVSTGGGSGLASVGSGSVSAINNWWGCDAAPGSAGCDTVSGGAITSPRIDLVVTAGTTTACSGVTTPITASFNQNSANGSISPTSLDGETVTFAVSGSGSVSPTTALVSGGTASTTFTAGATSAIVSATLDNGTDTRAISSGASTTASDPADQTVCEGATANFSTSASGSNLHYAWTLDGNAFGGDTSSINVPTTGLSYGTHTVGLTVTGDCGTVTQSATLTVNQNTATTDPADATVCQGATANFSTTASGTGPFTYAWTVDGSPAGGNSSTLNVDTTGLSVGSHSVSVTVTGACGNAVQTASLTVQANTVASDPADVTVCEGATANFSTTASGTNIHYAWTLDGNAFGGDTSSINVPTTGLSFGTHTVGLTVTGDCGAVSQSATLTVNQNTSTTDPSDALACEGSTATFSTTASGTGPFSFVWKQGATTLSNGSLGGRVTINSTATTSTLSISNVQPGDAGNYTVETTGACNTASQTASLTVNSAPPTITLKGNTISLWPPNHQYRTVNVTDLVASASDSCDASVDINDVVIANVTSDELDDNPGGADGSTINDMVIAANCKSVQLRAERDGNLDGRVYTITFRVTDSQGHVGTATAKVYVPLNQSGGTAVDSGPKNTVNGTCP
ncbi:MAG TPA: immunoglobulin domain-containing protein [Pyrinomonadaceae bacterium]|nr:immunoglobulin domain-containing protein [Pyrinomonadaceae bacterium]